MLKDTSVANSMSSSDRNSRSCLMKTCSNSADKSPPARANPSHLGVVGGVCSLCPSGIPSARVPSGFKRNTGLGAFDFCPFFDPVVIVSSPRPGRCIGPAALSCSLDSMIPRQELDVDYFLVCRFYQIRLLLNMPLF